MNERINKNFQNCEGFCSCLVLRFRNYLIPKIVDSMVLVAALTLATFLTNDLIGNEFVGKAISGVFSDEGTLFLAFVFLLIFIYRGVAIFCVSPNSPRLVVCCIIMLSFGVLIFSILSIIFTGLIRFSVSAVIVFLLFFVDMYFSYKKYHHSESEEIYSLYDIHLKNLGNTLIAYSNVLFYIILMNYFEVGNLNVSFNYAVTFFISGMAIFVIPWNFLLFKKNPLGLCNRWR